jgi:hypothetical protein
MRKAKAVAVRLPHAAAADADDAAIKPAADCALDDDDDDDDDAGRAGRRHPPALRAGGRAAVAAASESEEEAEDGDALESGAALLTRQESSVDWAAADLDSDSAHAAASARTLRGRRRAAARGVAGWGSLSASQLAGLVCAVCWAAGLLGLGAALYAANRRHAAAAGADAARERRWRRR